MRKGNEKLFKAIENNSIEEAELLLKRHFLIRKANPNANDGYFRDTPLHNASWKGKIEMVALLIHHGAKVNLKNRNGDTPLHYASSYNQTETIKYLINNGADINLMNKDAMNPLFIAIDKENLHIVELLIAKGADINIVNKNGDTPLLYAYEKFNKGKKDGIFWEEGKKDIVECLISNGAEVNVQDKLGRTPLSYECASALKCNKSLVEQFIKKGADVNGDTKNRANPLLNACKSNHSVEIVKLLVEKGANVNVSDPHSGDFTPLYYAVYYRKVELVRLLISKGADVNAKFAGNRTAIFESLEVENCEIFKILLASGADINIKDNTRGSLLSWAFTEEIATSLIEKGLVVNDKNSFGDTPLHFAAGGDNAKVVEVLIENGADPNAVNNNGETPLFRAHKKEIAALLIAFGANVNLQDNDGETPLFRRCYNPDSIDIIQLLINEGADVNITNHEGVHPLYGSIDASDVSTQTVKLLIENGAKVEDGILFIEKAMMYENKEILRILQNKVTTAKKRKNANTSYFASELKCAFCGFKNVTNRWPVNGDSVPLFFEKKKGRYSLAINCSNCYKKWYVVWDEDPGTVEKLNL
jgi:ankyrin repeat protein